MLSWGIGDFFIQKSTRKLGDWETLFVITLFGTLILIPFVYRSLFLVLSDSRSLYVLVGSALLLTAAAVFEFESFRRGKMSVVEPMLPFEIPAASVLAFVLLGDRITSLQFGLIVTLIVGLFLVSFRGRVFSLRYFVERGVFLGLLGAGLMGAADFLLGWGSRIADPLTANFVLNVVMVLCSGAVIVATGRSKRLLSDIRENRGVILIMSISDNVAWVGYAFAMSIIPIAIATGLSEASCIVAVLLGIFINREKLQRHQSVGLIIALASAIILAFVAV